MAKKKRTKGVRIGNVENGGCFYFNEWGEKCCIRSYELMLEDENGEWKKYNYDNEPDVERVYWIFYQSNKSCGIIEDEERNKMPISNAILLWEQEEGETEGIFLQKDDKKKKLNVLTWEAVYTQPETSKKMIYKLCELFCTDAIGRNIESICSEVKGLEMKTKDE